MHVVSSRSAVLAVAVTAGVLGAVVPDSQALAHVEVEADRAQAGARNVTLTFNGEAESDRVGISSERVVLPAGLDSGNVRLTKAPTGWTLRPLADGFTVAGPTLKPGQDAVFAVIVDQLPDGVTTLVFKTLETYSDGKVSRWIEVPEPGQPEPDNPAPVLKVKPAAGKPSTAVTTPPTVAPSTATSDAGPATAAAEGPSAPGDSQPGWWIVAVVAAVIAAGAGLLWRRRAGSLRP